jgi:peptide/nickel transport system ATP-binding protein
MAMIFQDPMTSLNPYLTVERQMTEVLQLHKGQDRHSARATCVRMLDAVRIPEAAKRIDMYPHEFSGGMRQRVMIAMALLCEPEVLIADEPTTALDVTVQAQMLLLLRDLQQDFGTAIVLITHDLGVVAGLCDQVVVLYGGRVMEQGNAQQLFKAATHPYTLGLLKAVPRMDRDDASLLAIPGAPPNMAHLPKGCPFSPRCPLADARAMTRWHRCRRCPVPAASCAPATVMWPWSKTPSNRSWPMAEAQQPILSVRDLKVEFSIKDSKGWPWTPARSLKAVNGISFDLHAGETLGVVGESGCGKSTLARAILNLNPANSGSIRWMGQEMQGASEAAWLSVRKDIQMIFQDPLASLNPRMTVAQIIAEPLRTHHPEMSPEEVMAKVRAIMARVGLTAQQINRYPHEFSGGQCQRIGIARALILQPKLIVCDEPVSALDVSIQAQIINLLKELQRSWAWR